MYVTDTKQDNAPDAVNYVTSLPLGMGGRPSSQHRRGTGLPVGDLVGLDLRSQLTRQPSTSDAAARPVPVSRTADRPPSSRVHQRRTVHGSKCVILYLVVDS